MNPAKWRRCRLNPKHSLKTEPVHINRKRSKKQTRTIKKTKGGNDADTENHKTHHFINFSGVKKRGLMIEEGG